MALIALDPDSRPRDVYIRPFDEGKPKGMCKDPKCHGELTAVSEVVVGGDVVRSSHWRHRVASDCSASKSGRDADTKTLWHSLWQLSCLDYSRIEYRHLVNGALRVADVMTAYDWAIEFQHSNISEQTVADRERHYLGQLLWVADATETGTSAAPDEFRGAFRWTQPPTWVSHAKALVAVDSGPFVYVLPPGYQMARVQQSIVAPMAHVKKYTRQEFIDQWVNGTSHPIRENFSTQWTLANLEAELNRRLKSGAARLARESEGKRALESEVCGYVGRGVVIEMATHAPSSDATWRKPRHQPFVMTDMDRAVALVMRDLGGVVVERIDHEVDA